MGFARPMAVTVLVWAVVVVIYVVVSLTTGQDSGVAEPAEPATPASRVGLSTAELLAFLGPADDVRPGCLPIGDPDGEARTAVFAHDAEDGAALVFVCYRK